MSGRGKRSKKDPNAPKRPLSAYILFSQDKRPEVTKAHPDWPVTEVMKEMGKMWAAASAKEKAKYEKLNEK